MNDRDNIQHDATAVDLDPAQARLAYSIINDLLEHTRVVGDLVALMAQVIDEETQDALTNTPVWTAYLDSRRQLEQTKIKVEEFSKIIVAIDGEDDQRVAD